MTDSGDSGDTVTVERFIPASADRLFALIADPSRHCEIDGSGTVRDANSLLSQEVLNPLVRPARKKTIEAMNKTLETIENLLATQAHPA